MSGESVPKPPLGLIPQHIHAVQARRERINEIIGAVVRYANEDKEVPLEWLFELMVLTRVKT